MISLMIRSLSVVIPAYNEEPNVALCLTNINTVLHQLSIKDWEIIFVDDGSLDETAKEAKKFYKAIKNLKVIENNPNRGYSGALRSGFAAATKDFIAFYPADRQFDFKEITKLINRQEVTNTDLVSGIRVGGGVDPFPRKLNRWGWNLVIRTLFGRLVTDIDCGFKLFRREILNQVSLTAEKGAMIDTQLLAAAKAKGYKFSEIPLTHLPRTAGNSTGSDLHVIIRSLIDLIIYWWHLKKEIWMKKK